MAHGTARESCQQPCSMYKHLLKGPYQAAAISPPCRLCQARNCAVSAKKSAPERLLQAGAAGLLRLPTLLATAWTSFGQLHHAHLSAVSFVCLFVCWHVHEQQIRLILMAGVCLRTMASPHAWCCWLHWELYNSWNWDSFHARCGPH